MARLALITTLLGLDGTPESGGKLLSQIKGTTTNTPLYAASSGGSTLLNPAVADSLGQITAYLENDTIEYTLTAKTADEAVTLWQVDVVDGLISLTYVNPAYDVFPLIEASWVPILATPAGSGWAGALVRPFNSVRYLTTYALMTALTASTGLEDGGVYYPTFRSSADIIRSDPPDAAGHFHFVLGDTTTPNGGSILADDANTGRFFLRDKPYRFGVFNAKGDNSTDDAAAIQACFTAVPAGGEVFTGRGQYRQSVKAAIAKAMTVTGEGQDSSYIISTSATNVIWEVSHEHVYIRGIRMKSTVNRSSGARSIDITAGSGVNAIWIDNCQLEGVATGIFANIGFIKVTNCLITMRAAAFSVGITGDNEAGMYIHNTFIATIGLDQLNQGYAGIDCSNCGNGVFTSNQMLTTGYGFLMAPGTGDLCTSLFFSDNLADHCEVGWQISPSGTAGVSIVLIENSWSASSRLNGVVITRSNTAQVSNIIFSSFTCHSNATVAALDGFAISGSVGDILLMGVIAFDHTSAADISIRGAASNIQLIGCMIGNNGFQSNMGLVIADTADNIIVANCRFATATTSKVSKTSSGTNIRFRDNLGYITQKKGSVATSTDGSGEITVNPGMNATPTIGGAWGTGTTAIHVQVKTKSATATVFRVSDMAGSPLASTAVTFDYYLEAA